MSAQFGHANDEPIARAPSAAIDQRLAESGADYEVALESLNQWQLAWRRFRRHRLALIGLGILAFMILLAIFGPIIWPFDSTEIPRPTRSSTRAAGRRSQHPFGETGGRSASSSCSSSTAPACR